MVINNYHFRSIRKILSFYYLFIIPVFSAPQTLTTNFLEVTRLMRASRSLRMAISTVQVVLQPAVGTVLVDAILVLAELPKIRNLPLRGAPNTLVGTRAIASVS